VSRALTSGILQRSQDADEVCLRAVKVHIDVLVIITEHDLEGLAKAVNV
jgi:hypothetical protein